VVTKVLIHEFAHALMDCGHNFLNDEFLQWTEEPLANMITLNISQASDSEFHKVVIDFINKQPANYKLGLELFNLPIPDVEWLNWCENKSTIAGKSKQKQDWVKYVSRGDYKKEELLKLFNALF